MKFKKKVTKPTTFLVQEISLYCYQMKYVIQVEDTICAICSPIGVGSIAVIRVSGPDAFRIVKKIFKAKNKKKFC